MKLSAARILIPAEPLSAAEECRSAIDAAVAEWDRQPTLSERRLELAMMAIKIAIVDLEEPKCNTLAISDRLYRYKLEIEKLT